jgi:hypothetical protein
VAAKLGGRLLLVQILFALIYVLLGIAFWAIVFRLSRASAAAIVHPSSKSLLTRVAALSLPLVLFTQYWALTHVFPLFVVAMYYALTLVASVLCHLIAEVIGHNQPEIRKKVSTLAVIGGMRFRRIFIGGGWLVYVVVITSWATSLWIYFSFSDSPLVAELYIAMSHFTGPAILNVFLLCFAMLPIVTSAYVDDDIRTNHLLSVFRMTILLTGWLLLPVYLMHQPEIALQPTLSKNAFALQKFWVIIPLPLFVFLFSGILPYFIGMYRYRIQVKTILEWRRNWLSRMSEVFKLPPIESRTGEINDLIGELERAIQSRFESNDLFQHFARLMSNSLDAYYSSPKDHPPLLDASLRPSQLPQQESSDATGKTLAHRTSKTLDQIEQAKWALQHSLPIRGAATTEPPSNVLEKTEHFLRENQDKLVEWDLRFSDLWQLLNLYRHTYQSADKELGEFLKFKLEETEKDLTRLSKRKNLLGGAIIFVGTTSLGWLLDKIGPKIGEMADKVWSWMN